MKQMGSLFNMGRKRSMFTNRRQNQTFMWLTLAGIGAAAIYGMAKRQNSLANILKPFKQQLKNSQLSNLIPTNQ